MSRPLDRLLDELGAAHRKGRIGERILEVDDEHGRPLPRLDRHLSVAAGDPSVVRRELEAHQVIPNSAFPAIEAGEDDGRSG